MTQDTKSSLYWTGGIVVGLVVLTLVMWAFGAF